MDEVVIFIPHDAKGERLDQWVSTHSAYTRSAFKQLVSQGLVEFDGTVVKKAGYKIATGGTLHIAQVSKMPSKINIPLDIVYEDAEMLIVNKPRGLLIYPVKDLAEPSLAGALLAYTALSDFAGKERPGIVHRIDRDTSGLVLVAKNNAIHEKLVNLLARHEICREYIGITHRSFAQSTGTINANIAHDRAHGTKRIVVRTGGQEAITHYKCVYQNDEYSIMRFLLETGRTHQIRVHMASIGHPLVGDGLYGAERNVFGFKGQALHAVRLCFSHPMTGKLIDVYGKPPEIFRKAVLRIQMMK